ncbi:partial Trehalose-phosphate phosphatase, partial [Anaerolineae bacterium]
LEISSTHFSMTYDIGRSAREALGRLRGVLMELEEKFKGVLVEDKTLTITVHYRLLARELFESFREAFERACVPELRDGHVRLTRSRKAFELRANVRWDKGKTLLWLMERPLFRGTTPLYMGDDYTDMDAYRSVGLKGVSVNVGRPVDEAAYFLNSQKEVAPFLKWLVRSCPMESARLVDFAI